jgi:hypothetical protein
MGFDLGHFLSDAGSAIGKAADGVVHAIGDSFTWPFTVANDILKGQAIDHAFMDGFRQAVHSIKVLGPYVQAVIAFVPGIGPICGAAIGGGIALAEGKPIDEVMMSAVAGAVPGGVFVKDAYEIGKAAIEKKPALGIITQGVLDLAGNLGTIIPEGARDALIAGLGMSQNTINGVQVAVHDVESVVDKIPDPIKKAAIREAMNPGSKVNVADVVIDSALDMVPGIDAKAKMSIKHGMAIGMAMTHGKNLQEAAKKDAVTPVAAQKLSHAAANIVQSDPVIAAARTNLNGQGVQGFDQGIALAHTPGVTQAQLLAVRNSLGPKSDAQGNVAVAPHGEERYHHHDHFHARSGYSRYQDRGREPLRHKWSNDQLAFDTALALHIGRRFGKRPPGSFTFRQRAAHAVTYGLRNAPPHIAQPVMHTINDAGSASGVKLAESQLENRPLLWTLGAGVLGLVVAGPVGAVVGLGGGYMLSSGGFFEDKA